MTGRSCRALVFGGHSPRDTPAADRSPFGMIGAVGCLFQSDVTSSLRGREGRGTLFGRMFDANPAGLGIRVVELGAVLLLAIAARAVPIR